MLPVEGQDNQVQPEEFGAPVIKMHEYRRGDPRVIWEIRQKIHQYNVRLIHVHQNYSGGMASLAVLANKHVCVVNTEHSAHMGFKKPASNPCSVSKAMADVLVMSYFKTYRLPIIIVRSSNNFGPNQYSENIIPLFVKNVLKNKSLLFLKRTENC